MITDYSIIFSYIIDIIDMSIQTIDKIEIIKKS